ncbi:helix-turn-helix domain-containing protein, partial [Enterobacter hormaechei]|uniref:helix-turn-helix domain-containing protein n=1 Tax=Enterobacter hormaechei TaxID=158836 RepID=UPI003B9AA2E0
YGPQNDVTLKMPAFEWVHVQLHQQKGMISLSPPTICNSAVQTLTQRGVHIEFVKEHLSFTGEDSPMANLMLSVMGAFAEFERALIRERQREGIALAKQRGAYRGRKKSLSSERIAELRQRVEAGEQKTKLAREFGISRETLYQYLRTDQ